MEKLTIYTYIDGVNDTLFYDGKNPVSLTNAEVSIELMGTFSITGTLKWPVCLDSYWTGLQYVVFRGERYFIRNTPSSSYSHEEVVYTHELEFLSEKDMVLGNTYFIDAVQGDSDKDVFKSNSTDVIFFGDINELVARLNAAARYSGLDYTFVVDGGVTTEPQMVSFTDKYFLDAMKESYDIFKVPFYFIGKACHFGHTNNTVNRVFRYGATDALMSIKKGNDNAAIIRRITGVGSSENIPYYYPNNSPKGNIDVEVGTSNVTLQKANIEIVNYEKFANAVDLDKDITYMKGAATLSDYRRNGEIYTATPISIDVTSVESITDVYTAKITITKTGAVKIQPTMYREGIAVKPLASVITFYEITDELSGNLVSAYNDDDYIYTDAVEQGHTLLITINYTLRKIYTFKYVYSAGLALSNAGTWVTGVSETVGVDDILREENFLNGNPYNGEQLPFVLDEDRYEISPIFKYEKAFVLNKDGFITADIALKIGGVLDNTPLENSRISSYSIKTGNNTIPLEKLSGKSFRSGYLQAGINYILSIEYFLNSRNTQGLDWTFQTDVSLSFVGAIKEYKSVDMNDLGIEINITPSDGDSFRQILINKITPAANLMPPIYRETLGAERFYNAINDLHPKGSTEFAIDFNPKTGELVSVEADAYYTFVNEYNKVIPSEGKKDFEDIKPTVEGMTNASGQIMAQFLDVAFDDGDNDEQDEDGNYLHPYFFAKLPKFDGQYGFNLFACALESGEMTFSMTSGPCGGCSFILGVDSETSRNIVQVDENGNLKRDKDGNVLWSGQQSQDIQNDTRESEVWVALKKEYSTFGVIMPNATNNYRPKAGDTFVILNILLPNAYILNAENMLYHALLQYMESNNEDKFTFTIDFSSIYFAENPEVESQLLENSRINVLYDKTEYEFHISSYSYSIDEDSALPTIKVNITDAVKSKTTSLARKLSDISDEQKTILQQTQRTVNYAKSDSVGGSALNAKSADKVGSPLRIKSQGREYTYDGSSETEIYIEDAIGLDKVVTLDTEQSIMAKKTFKADTVFEGKLYLPSPDGSEKYDMYVDTAKSIEGTEQENPDLPGYVKEETVGDLADLSTEEKTTLVGAINETVTRIDGLSSPKWYGVVDASGNATKLGGSETLQCAIEETGKYRFYKLFGTYSVSSVIVTPMLSSISSSALPVFHTSVVLFDSKQGITVCMYDRNGLLSNYAFSILIL